MEDYTKPDMAAAARHLSNAATSVLEAIRALRNHDRTFDLKAVAKGLDEKAKHFGAERLLGGLKEPLIDARTGAMVMGRSASAEKLAGLVKARQALADKRRDEATQTWVRNTTAKHTKKLARVAKLAAAAVKRASMPPPIIPTPAPVIPEVLAVPVSPPSVPMKRPIAIQEV